MLNGKNFKFPQLLSNLELDMFTVVCKLIQSGESTIELLKKVETYTHQEQRILHHFLEGKTIGPVSLLSVFLEGEKPRKNAIVNFVLEKQTLSSKRVNTHSPSFYESIFLRQNYDIHAQVLLRAIQVPEAYFCGSDQDKIAVLYKAAQNPDSFPIFKEALNNPTLFSKLLYQHDHTPHWKFLFILFTANFPKEKTNTLLEIICQKKPDIFLKLEELQNHSENGEDLIKPLLSFCSYHREVNLFSSMAFLAKYARNPEEIFSMRDLLFPKEKEKEVSEEGVFNFLPYDACYPLFYIILMRNLAQISGKNYRENNALLIWKMTFHKVASYLHNVSKENKNAFYYEMCAYIYLFDSIITSMSKMYYVPEKNGVIVNPSWQTTDEKLEKLRTLSLAIEHYEKAKQLGGLSKESTYNYWLARLILVDMDTRDTMIEEFNLAKLQSPELFDSLFSSSIIQFVLDENKRFKEDIMGQFDLLTPEEESAIEVGSELLSIAYMKEWPNDLFSQYVTIIDALVSSHGFYDFLGLVKKNLPKENKKSLLFSGQVTLPTSFLEKLFARKNIGYKLDASTLNYLLKESPQQPILYPEPSFFINLVSLLKGQSPYNIEELISLISQIKIPLAFSCALAEEKVVIFYFIGQLPHAFKIMKAFLSNDSFFYKIAYLEDGSYDLQFPGILFTYSISLDELNELLYILYRKDSMILPLFLEGKRTFLSMTSSVYTILRSSSHYSSLPILREITLADQAVSLEEDRTNAVFSKGYSILENGFPILDNQIVVEDLINPLVSIFHSDFLTLLHLETLQSEFKRIMTVAVAQSATVSVMQLLYIWNIYDLLIKRKKIEAELYKKDLLILFESVRKTDIVPECLEKQINALLRSDTSKKKISAQEQIKRLFTHRHDILLKIFQEFSYFTPNAYLDFDAPILRIWKDIFQTGMTLLEKIVNKEGNGATFRKNKSLAYRALGEWHFFAAQVVSIAEYYRRQEKSGQVNPFWKDREKKIAHLTSAVSFFERFSQEMPIHQDNDLLYNYWLARFLLIESEQIPYKKRALEKTFREDFWFLFNSTKRFLVVFTQLPFKGYAEEFTLKKELEHKFKKRKTLRRTSETLVNIEVGKGAISAAPSEEDTAFNPDSPNSDESIDNSAADTASLTIVEETNPYLTWLSGFERYRIKDNIALKLKEEPSALLEKDSLILSECHFWDYFLKALPATPISSKLMNQLRKTHPQDIPLLVDEQFKSPHYACGLGAAKEELNKLAEGGEIKLRRKNQNGIVFNPQQGFKMRAAQEDERQHTIEFRLTIIGKQGQKMNVIFLVFGCRDLTHKEYARGVGGRVYYDLTYSLQDELKNEEKLAVEKFSKRRIK